MSDGIERPTKVSEDGDEPGVLANLPRTRPQRSSPRRAAARRQAARSAAADTVPPSSERSERRAPRSATDNGAAGEPAAGTRAATGKAAGKRASRTRAGRRPAGVRRPLASVPRVEEVPSQGYESDDDTATGAVNPPGGAELLISAAEMVGELAKAGISRSERLLKDALSRLPLA
jgi:hypothetical protein